MFKSTRYNEWSDTALLLHSVSQMMGKAKLARMEPQPEWKHIVLQLTADGFTTGLIPAQEKTFSISLLIREGKVLTTCVDGRTSGFTFENGLSIADYYAEFNRMLEDVMCPTKIYSMPMGMGVNIPFEKNREPRDYNNQRATDFYHMCAFAHNTLLRFCSPYRGKKIMPSFFWGTFDVTTVLFNGRPRPFEAGRGIIERVAFDEQMIEFGFRPGDGETPEPSFFILPYPFMAKDLSKSGIKPEQAFYSKPKAQFFLKLEDALAAPEPEETVQEFLTSGYQIITKVEKWKNLEWLNQPLLAHKGSSALN